MFDNYLNGFYTHQDGNVMVGNASGGVTPLSLDQRAAIAKQDDRIYYKTIDIDLSIVRDGKTGEAIYGEIGDSLLCSSITGAAFIRFNSERNSLLNLNIERSVKFNYQAAFWRFFITNAAQVGKVARLVIGKGTEFSAGDIVTPVPTVIVTPGGLSVTPVQDTVMINSQFAAKAVGVASALVMAANANRTYAALRNTTGAPIDLGFGAAAVLGAGLRLPLLNSVFEMTRLNLYKGAIYAISNVAAQSLATMECDLA